MLVDQDPFPNTMPVNMLTPKFQLVLDMSSEEPKQASAFNRWRKFQGHGSPESPVLCARCHAELQGSERSQQTPNASSRVPKRRHIRR
jgi:hypothetical protein